jgi:hypothetical protein
MRRVGANPDVSTQRTATEAPCDADVVRWRRDRLLAAGFADELAAELARSRQIDLHALLDLIDRGCPPPVAASILAPLDEPTQPEHPR